MKKMSFAVIAAVAVAAIVIIGLRLVTSAGDSAALHLAGRAGQTVEVVHWSNGHLMRAGLMKDMADKFNSEDHRSTDGRRIHVQVYNHGSAEQADDLLSRITRGVPTMRDVPDPTICTPSSADWLTDVNAGVGRTVIDLTSARSITRAYVGIVTYRDMAEALGWPDKEIGFADIIALRNDPQGWASVPGARVEWGQKPLVAFTDPRTSTTGRSVLFSLYAIAAGKTPEQLTLADVSDPGVVAYVKNFQTMIDHYMTGTIPLNTKVYQGPRYGHFFIMPEDNLISLYEGTETALIDGVSVKAPPITEPMVMIYPKEGSMVRNNIAGMVQAPWVTPEQHEAAEKWVDYLLQDEQQRAFLADGFRPATDLSVTGPGSKISGKYGLEPVPRTKLITLEQIDSKVAGAIEQSWDEVKRPGIVTFVMDTSGSMSGTKLDQAKQGMVRAVDGMARNNEVGFVTFSSAIVREIPVAPLNVNRFVITNAVEQVKAQGNTALYDAIKAGMEMTDSAEGGADAIRAVVVLTDGKANVGATRLDDLIAMMSLNEATIREFRGFETDISGIDATGAHTPKRDIIGNGPALKTAHPIQVFFIGIGGDADMEIGRMLAQATGAEFQGVTEKDLASILEEFSKYF
jgi:Ca-activated chloride channel family protein